MHRTRLFFGAIFIALLIGGITIRASLASHPGHQSDMELNQLWTQSAVLFGPATSFERQIFYAPWPNHGPTEIYLYALSGHLYRMIIAPDFSIHQPAFRIFVKLFPMIFDILIGTAFFIFFAYKKNYVKGLVAFGMFAVHPIFWHESALWGQTDSIALGLMGMSFLCFVRRIPILGGGLFALSVLHKPQAVIFIPLLLVFFLKERKQFLDAFISGMLTAIAVLTPLYITGTLDQIFRVYTEMHLATGEVSQNAFNFWWVIFDEQANFHYSNEHVGLLTLKQIGTLLFACTYVVSILYFARLFFAKYQADLVRTFFIAASYVSLGFFLFNTGMHERYLYAYALLGLPLAFTHWKDALLYIGITTVFFFNNLYVLPGYSWVEEILQSVPKLPLALAELQLFFFLLFTLRYMLPAFSVPRDVFYPCSYKGGAKTLTASALLRPLCGLPQQILQAFRFASSTKKEQSFPFTSSDADPTQEE